MKKLIQNKAFYFGFITSFLLMLCLNLFLYFASDNCHHCYPNAGFPFIFWVNQIDFTFNYSADGRLLPFNDMQHFSLTNLATDILITVVFCFAVGFIAKLVSSGISTRGGLR